MRIWNIENLDKWLRRILKEYDNNYEPYLDELLKQWINSGTTIYEIKGKETKSKKLERYHYEIALTFYNEKNEVIDPT